MLYLGMDSSRHDDDIPNVDGRTTEAKVKKGQLRPFLFDKIYTSVLIIFCNSASLDSF